MNSVQGRRNMLENDTQQLKYRPLLSDRVYLLHVRGRLLLVQRQQRQEALEHFYPFLTFEPKVSLFLSLFQMAKTRKKFSLKRKFVLELSICNFSH